MSTNVLSIRTITDLLTPAERNEFWHYLGGEVTSREAETGIVGPSKVKEILGFYMDLTAKDSRDRGIVFPKGAKFQLEL
jgi:hypothetical protein